MHVAILRVSMKSEKCVFDLNVLLLSTFSFVAGLPKGTVYNMPGKDRSS